MRSSQILHFRYLTVCMPYHKRKHYATRCYICSLGGRTVTDFGLESTCHPREKGVAHRPPLLLLRFSSCLRNSPSPTPLTMDPAPTQVNPFLGPLLLRALLSGTQPAARGDCDCTGERCLCHEPEAYAINNLSRCHHIQFMNMDIHGEARDYLGAMDASTDKIEGHHGVGTWRLPASRSACASFLWRLWEMPALGRDRSDIPDRQVIRGMYDGIHKVRKE